MRFNPSVLHRNLLFFLYILYYAQGSVYPSGSIISQLALFSIYAISIFYFYKTFIIGKKNSFYWFWTALLLLNISGFFLAGGYHNSSMINMFKGTMGALLGFYPFYYFAYKNVVNTTHFAWFLFGLLPVTVLQFFVNQSNFITEYETENVVNNFAYAFVGLIPFLFFIRHRVKAFVALAIIIFFVILGAKRGAIFSGAIGISIYLFYLLKSIKHISHINKIKIYSGFVVGLSIMGYYAYQFFYQNEFLLRRFKLMTEGNSSGRTENFAAILETWYSSPNFFNLLLGFGFASSLEITGSHFAHNDWLELLSNFGLLGVFLYLMIFFGALKYFRNKNYSFQERMMLLCILSIWFFMTMVSMWYTVLGTFTQAILIGYLFGTKNRIETHSI